MKTKDIAVFDFDPMEANKLVTLTVRLRVSTLKRWRHKLQTNLGFAFVRLGAWIAQVGIKADAEMSIEETLTAECIEVLMSGLSWKSSEGAMDSEGWRAVEPFLAEVKMRHPEIAARYLHLFE